MMDELETMDTNVVVLASTNKTDSLDEAVIKRFFIRFVVKNPDLEERKDMIEKQIDQCDFGEEKLTRLATLTDGLSFCAIKQVIGELYNGRYLKDLQSTHFRKDDSTGVYYACDPKHKNAKKKYIGELPFNSLRANPLSFECLEERFSKCKKGTDMTNELQRFEDEYCTKEFS